MNEIIKFFPGFVLVTLWGKKKKKERERKKNPCLKGRSLWSLSLPKDIKNITQFAMVELEVKFGCRSLLEAGTLSHFGGQLWGFMGGLSLTEIDPLQVSAPAEFPASWNWLIWCPLMEISQLPALLACSVFCGLQMLSSDTEEVDIPYKCYTHLHVCIGNV